jgi:predicted dehydrogenase
LSLAEGKIRVGVVGLGSFGRHHARHYAANPAAIVAGFADTAVDRARAAAAAYGGSAHRDHAALIGSVDAVSVTVPTDDHYRVARDFIDAGVHVLVEKPITGLSASARDLIARADRAGVVLQVGHIERFSPAVVELARQGAEVRRISAVRHAPPGARNAGTDVVFDLMIHDIDLAIAFAGARVATVAASAAADSSGVLAEAEAWLTFANGVVATLSASRVAPRHERTLTMVGTDEVWLVDLAAPGLTVFRRRGESSAPESRALPETDKLAVEVAAFLHSVGTGAAPLVDGRAGLAALEAAERIHAAIADEVDTALALAGAPGP